MMCRSSTTTIGSRVVSTDTCGAGRATLTFSLTASATSVPLLGAVEEPESHDEHHDGPAERVPPQMARRLVQGVADVDTVGVEQRVAGQLDEDVTRVGVEHVPDPG